VRASKKLRNDELLVTGLAGTRLRMELDRVPLWRGDSVAIKQLAEDFARYLYLPRLTGPGVLIGAIRDGLGLLLWRQESFAYADSFDEAANRYRGLRSGQLVALSEENLTGLLVHPDIAVKQQQTEAPVTVGTDNGGVEAGDEETTERGAVRTPEVASGPKRFHGTVKLDSTRVGRDAGKIAEEVIAHLVSLQGVTVKVTLEIEAEIPGGAPDNVVRTVTENSRTLKFTSHGFEKE
jgi:hypothetical protein